MRDFSQIPRWSPRPWEHEEDDPRIDKALQHCAKALREGVSPQAVWGILTSRGAVPEVAFNLLNAALVLVGSDK